jgi:RimJ/RimL family protein N-acetyltransferase
MIGDVNLFISDFPPSSSDDDTDTDDAKQIWAECEVMIAESSFRNRGCAREALILMLSFALQRLPRPSPSHPPRFFARIGTSNQRSLALFEGLGFERHRVVEAFQEVELRARVADTAEAGWGNDVTLTTIEYNDP